ncbi:MAG: biotin--[acetyl-CoA-carboxylase] ligase [Gemmatimonadales bacterium]
MTHRLEGFDGHALAAHLGVPRVELRARVTSTMDEAHRLATAGAPAGTFVIADEQTAGRGRSGRRWASPPGHGLWMTLLERPGTESGLDVLSLRLGLCLAPALEQFTGRGVSLKWPNDLYVGDGKLAGILVEARWREQRPEWVAIGVGVNVVPPADVPASAGVREATTRVHLLQALAPAMREASRARGTLVESELAEFARRDYARGRRCAVPAHGVAQGITCDGALIVRTASGVAHYRGGSLELEVEATAAR